MIRVLLFCCIAWAIVGCGPRSSDESTGQAEAPEGQQPAFLNARTGVAFTGDAACFDCHEAEYRGYQEHGMARSFYPLTADVVVEDFAAEPLYHEASGFYYRPFREGDRFFQEEYRIGPSGERTHRLVREIRYVVGSGTAARTYLTESNNRLYELPITWYTQAKKWDFSPGYRERNSRFDRLVPDRCMVCHNSYPETVPFVAGKYDSVPHGIGCERCHGPGSLHIEARLATPEAAGEVDYTIVNPAHLTLDRRLDVCQQCHLNGTVSVLREGRTPFDFRPSQDLSDYVAMFAEASPGNADAIGVISHAQRMKESACFIETRAAGGAMDCVTCHNPHEEFRTKGPAYFNATCMTCHAVAELQASFTTPEIRATHTVEANCASCHMPKVGAEDAPHSNFTDHKIRVVTSLPQATPLAAHEVVTLRPYIETSTSRRESPVYEGIGYIVYGRQNGDSLSFVRGIEILTKALAEEPEHGEGQFLLGFAHLQLGNVESAIPPLEASIRLDAGVPERLNALAQAYEAAGRDPERIRRLYERALSIQPALADVRLNYGRFLEAGGRLEQAVEQYEAAIREQPWLARAHYNLGTVHLRQQDFAKAEPALLRALELEPDDPETLGNLGLMYAIQDRPADARRYFAQAVEAAPSNPTALANFGAFHLNQGDLQEAIQYLERAVRYDARHVDALANLSLAYFRAGRPADARRYALQTLDVAPNQPLARQILGAL